MPSAQERTLTSVPPSRPPHPPPDEELLQRIAAGEEPALAELYRRHARAVLAIGRRLLGDDQAAEELVQDTFVQVWRRAATFEGRASARAWLWGVARYLALNHRRRPPLPVPGDVPERPDEAAGPEDVVLDRLERDELDALVRRLPAPQRDVVLLSFTAGLTCAEVAEVLGDPVGTVKSRLFRARRQLALWRHETLEESS